MSLGSTHHDHSLESPVSIFLCNLLLLGFSPKEHAAGIFSNISFDESIFSHANNNKAFEATSYFLFNKLDPVRTRSTFRYCWPLTDYGRHSREYRSAAYRWLEELRRENCLPGHVILRRSYFEDCRGERIENIMMAFSNFVLQKVLDRELTRGENAIRILDQAIPVTDNTNQLRETLESEIERMSSRIASAVQNPRNSDEPWLEVAKLVLSPSRALEYWTGFAKRSTAKGKEPLSTFNTKPIADIGDNRDRLQHQLSHTERTNESRPETVTEKKNMALSAEKAKERSEKLYSILHANESEDDASSSGLMLPSIAYEISTADGVNLVKKYIDEQVRLSTFKRNRNSDTENENKPDDVATAEKAEDRDKDTIYTRSSPAKSLELELQADAESSRQRSSSGFRPLRELNLQANAETSSVAANEEDFKFSLSSFQRQSFTLDSPDSPFSANVSPMSSSFPDYCDLIVNQFMHDFHGQRTPPSGRLSMSALEPERGSSSPPSQRSWRSPWEKTETRDEDAENV